MFRRLIGRRPASPRLLVAQRVIDKMVAAAQTYVEDETGEAMIGLILPPADDQPETIVVLDTISPADDGVVRAAHTFQQGDAWQDEMIWWFQENWHVYRQQKKRGIGGGSFKWDSPVWFLGDWHKQPGYMIAPSGGDLNTAIDWLLAPDAQNEFLLAPIVTIDHPATIDPEVNGGNYVIVPQGDGYAVRIDWWYIHRDAHIFQPIMPTVQADDKLPHLTQEQPWHLRDEDRFRDEFGRLTAAQMAVSTTLANTKDKLPLEVCISAARMGGKHIYLMATQWDYPESAPVMRLTPFQPLPEGKEIGDMFGEWWEYGRKVDPPKDWTWTPDKTLLDFIEAVEKDQGIAVAKPASTDDTTTEDES